MIMVWFWYFFRNISIHKLHYYNGLSFFDWKPKTTKPKKHYLHDFYQQFFVIFHEKNSVSRLILAVFWKVFSYPYYNIMMVFIFHKNVIFNVDSQLLSWLLCSFFGKLMIILSKKVTIVLWFWTIFLKISVTRLPYSQAYFLRSAVAWKWLGWKEDLEDIKSE